MSNSKAELVYLLAASHSGSTLTAMLLNSHPKICTAGELKLTGLSAEDAYRCSCRSLLSDCEFWLQVAERMRASGHSFDPFDARTDLMSIQGSYLRRFLRPLHRGALLEAMRDTALHLHPAWRNRLGEWGRRNAALIQSVAAQAESDLVVDSSKTAVRLKYLRKAADIRIKVVRVVRDGRAVALTYMRPSDFADARDPGLRGGGSGKQVHPMLSMAEAAELWKRSNLEAENAVAGMRADSVIQIRYEELCKDPQGVLNSAYSFLGVEPSDSYTKFRDAPHHVVGNGMRLDGDSEIRLDDRWRAELTENELATFDAVAGDLNRSYGYE